MSEISQEPVPYFRQLCEAQYTTSSRPSSASSQSSTQSTIVEEFSGELEQIHRSTQVKQTLRVNTVQGHLTDCSGKLSVREALNPLQFSEENFHLELS